MALLKAQGVVKTFPGVVALNNVNLTIRPGTIHCIIGENGAGKSTLVKVLTGVYIPDKGEVTIDGDNALQHPRDNKGIFNFFRQGGARSRGKLSISTKLKLRVMKSGSSF